MTISLKKVGKRYQNHWIFKGITYTFEEGSQYALLGANGSGKSTLLRIIGGMQHLNLGTIDYERSAGLNRAPEMIFNYVSYCAPGMDIIEELSLREFLNFHFSFKKIMPGYSINSVLAAMGMESVAHKFIHEFSSGMKQRAKLAQAFFTHTPILLLDEPCSNLDQQGVAMYQQWRKKHVKNRLVIIASNDEREYEGVADTIFMQDYK